MNKSRVVLADDHTLVRAGLRKLLESIPDMEVVGEANDGAALLELATAVQPDLILMDIAMPGLNGLDATARVVQTCPRARVVILSMHQSEEYVRQALRNGAVAYLLKDAAPLELDQALQAVLRGEIYLSPAVSKGVMSDYVQRLRGDAALPELLTPRQREILKLIAEGKSTKDIAKILEISIKTVDTHRSQLMKQLNVHEIASLVRHALRMGLVSVND